MGVMSILNQFHLSCLSQTYLFTLSLSFINVSELQLILIFSAHKRRPTTLSLLWCKLKLEQPCYLKVVPGDVVTRHLTRVNTAKCHQAILYLLQTEEELRICSESPSYIRSVV
jgi:hypothetical protein